MPSPEKIADVLENDPLWYKDAVIYELHVRAFHDSNGDGIGDFRGLTQKLDYLQDLGVTAIWLLPFCQSPLRDDGYDISDFTNINPSYGARRDVQAFVREAHRRGLRVITELVVNHTSDQHPWFQRARKSPPGSKWRDFYVWSDTYEKYKGTRIIFKDTELSNWSWDAVAQAYYWHRFFSHQPDLNFENPEVQKSILQVMEFWLDMGVDGLRLDAVPYLYEEEGTSCENLPQTHEFLKKLRKQIDKKYQNRMLLAEANQWPEDAAAYFGDGDECHMNFHFPLMPRLFMAMQMEDRFPILDILEQTPDIPPNCQWGLFLRNHDELTLEMVTDEERDYMYRVFAHDRQARINLGIRRRLAPLLGNDRKKIELMYSLLFTMPGTPVIYYGEEIGMGDNFYLGDRNGVRTPMQWSADRNAGFSKANPQKLYLPIIMDPEYHYEALNVEVQQNNAQSLLWWMKRTLSLRKQYKSFGRGDIEFLQPSNRKVLVFLRQCEGETILVAANLSRYAQCVELELGKFKGMVPMTLAGKVKFPPIGDLPYFLTLGGHTFYWFLLETPQTEATTTGLSLETLPSLTVNRGWEYLTHGRDKARLERILPRFLQERRWFGGKARHIHSVHISDYVPMPSDNPLAVTCMLHVEFSEGEPESYILPVGFMTTDYAVNLQDTPAALAQVQVQHRGQKQDGLLHDVLWNPEFLKFLLQSISRNRRFNGPSGDLVTTVLKPFRRDLQTQAMTLEPSLHRGEQSNTSVIFDQQYIMKIFRRAEPGINPDLEIGRFLTERKFPYTSQVAGAIEYQPDQGEPTTIGILHQFVPNEGDAWRFTLDEISRYFENALTQPPLDTTSPALSHKPLLELLDQDLPDIAEEMIGGYLEEARLIGQRTGELHVTLASEHEDPDFAPEPFTDFYRRGLYQSMIKSISQNFPLLKQLVKDLPESIQPIAKQVVALEATVRRQFLPIRDLKITGKRLRIHGDYHLGQVLYTGKDFLIIDFEGEPARPLNVRRLKESPLRDVAGMLRSFHYAAYSSLIGKVAGIRPEDFVLLEPWANLWQVWVSATFLKAYFTATAESDFLPKTQKELQILLDAYTLQKAVYELGYELNNRPDWARIPLEGILQILEASDN